MQKSVVGENQQEIDARIPWFAGWFDGEGSIGIYANGRGTYYVRVTLTNTDELAKEVILKILKDYEIPAYIYVDNSGQPKGWKQRWQMIFAGNTKPRKLLELLIPFLVTKRSEALLALEFIELTSNNRYENRIGSRWSKRELNPRETEIVALIKELKHSRPSETIRETH